MGLFSKKKEDNAGQRMQMPPMPPSLSEAKQEEMKNQQVPKYVPSQKESRLTAPPLPGNLSSLEDIKNQVAQAPKMQNQIEEENEEPVQENAQLPSQPVDNTENENTEINADDDLFSMFGVGNPKDMIPSAEENTNTSSDHEEEQDKEINLIDENLHREEYFSFDSKKISKTDSKFLTTSQFKSMLEIVEQVKNKVKEGNDTHLRLLDMKAEEDIEYENLRKTFQVLEDKLYELDNIIFDN